MSRYIVTRTEWAEVEAQSEAEAIDRATFAGPEDLAWETSDLKAARLQARVDDQWNTGPASQEVDYR